METWNLDLIRRYDQPGPRYTSWPPANHFHEEISADDYWQALERGNVERRPLSLYVHIPFCRHVCYYCACNRVITADHSRATEYLRRLIRELKQKASRLDTSRPVTQMHWGGGTPTYLDDPEITELVYQTARALRLLEDDRGDYSIELDPRTLDPQRVGLLRGLGFNRASLGIQDLDPRVQRAVNRVQSLELIENSFGWLRDHGFQSINADLIYGLPWQSTSSLTRTIEQLVALRPDRIALYNYAHLPARFKVQRQIDELALPAPEEKLRMLVRASTMLEEAGYQYVGMDHFALPHDELARASRNGSLHRNFQGYTLHGDADLLGIGMSAISQFGNFYGQNLKSLSAWQEAVDEERLPLERGYILDRDDEIRRDLITRLLCDMRLDLRAFGERWQCNAVDRFADELERLRPLEADGLLVRDGDVVQLTDDGRRLARAVAMVFDTTLPRDRTRFSRII